MSDKDLQNEIADGNDKQDDEHEAGASASIANEVAGQLNEYQGRRVSDSISSVLENKLFMGDKERAEAIAGVGKSLDSMVKGDLPHLISRLKELGVSTAELEAKEKELGKKVEEAKPLQEAVLKGDITALQKLVANTKPEQLKEMVDLIQKHFDKIGMGLDLDLTDGKLIISRDNGDRAVAISKDKLDVIGVNKDGSYDFTRHFRRENPAAELKGFTDGALNNYMFPPRRFHDFDPGYKIQPFPHERPNIMQDMEIKPLHKK